MGATNTSQRGHMPWLAVTLLLLFVHARTGALPARWQDAARHQMGRWRCRLAARALADALLASNIASFLPLPCL